MDVIIFIFGSLFFLFFVSALGHFAWVAVAHVLGGINSKRCPECDSRIDASDKACRQCGWTSKPISRDQAMLICRQALDSALSRSVIDTETHIRGKGLLEALEASFSNVNAHGLQTTDSIVAANLHVVTPAVSGDNANSLPAVANYLEVDAEAHADNSESSLVPAIAAIVDSELPTATLLEGSANDGSVHALDRDYSDSAASQWSAPAALKRTWSKWLSSFMEEKNIQWGELAGGLLVVCCSIALVISFWSQIAARPWLKFSIFTGVNAATLLVGLNAWHRWRLPTTSRGILLVGVLLVPLNFLAFAVLTLGMPWDWLTVAGELLSLAVLSVLVWNAARVITPKWPVEVCVAAIGFAVSNLLIRRFVSHDSNSLLLYVAGAAILGLYSGTSILGLLKSIAGLRVGNDETQRGLPPAGELLRTLGVTVFGFVVACGLLVFCAGDVYLAIHKLSPVILAAVGPAIAYAVHLGKYESARSRVQLFAMGLGAVSISIALYACVTSLPTPILTIACLLILAAILHYAGVGLDVIAYRYSTYLLGGIVFCIGVQCAISVLPVFNEEWSTFWYAVGSVEAGWSFVAWSLFCGVAAFALGRLNRLEDSLMALRSGGGFALAGTVALTVFGFGRPQYATSVAIVYLTYAVSLSVVGFLRKNPWMDTFASVFALAACSQYIGFGWLNGTTVAIAIFWTFMATSIITLAFALIRRWFEHAALDSGTSESRFVWWSALYAGIASAVLVYRVAVNEILLYQDSQTNVSPWGVFLVALVWLAITGFTRRNEFSINAQFFLWLSGALAIVHGSRNSSWVYGTFADWLHPYNLIPLCLWSVLLATLAIVLFKVLRQRVTWFRENESLCRHQFFNSIMTAAVVVFVLLACYSAVPGVMQELVPKASIKQMVSMPYVVNGVKEVRDVADLSQFSVEQIPWQAICWDSSVGTNQFAGLPVIFWAWVGICLLLVLRCLVDHSIKNLQLTTVAMASIAFPIAAGWYPDVAVASAMRWTTSMAFCVLATLLFAWYQIGQSRSDSISEESRTEKRLELSKYFDALFSILLGVAGVPYVFMATIVILGAVGYLSPISSFDAVRVCAICSSLVGMALLLWGTLQRTAPESTNKQSVLSSASGVACILGSVAWLMFEIVLVITRYPLTGPNPDSLFVRMGLAASYSIPVLSIAIGLMVGSAVRRAPAIAFSANIVLQIAGIAGYLLTLKSLAVRPAAWIGMLAMLCIVGSSFALVWSLYTNWRDRYTTIRFSAFSNEVVSKSRQFWLDISRALATTYLLSGMGATLLMFWYIGGSDAELRYSSIALLVGLLLFGLMRLNAFRSTSLAALCLGAVILVAVIVASFGMPTSYALVTQCTGLGFVVVILIAVAWRGKRELPTYTVGTALVLASFMSLRALDLFASELHVAVTVLWGVSILSFIVALRWERRVYAIGSLIVGLFGGVVFSLLTLHYQSYGFHLYHPILVLIALFGLYGAAFAFTKFTRASWLLVNVGVASLTLLCACWYFGSLNATRESFPLVSIVSAWVIALGSVIVQKAKGQSNYPYSKLYILGLCGTSIFFHFLNTNPVTLAWISTLLFGAFELAYATLWRMGDRFQTSLGGTRWLKDEMLKTSDNDASGVICLMALNAAMVSCLGLASQFLCPLQPLRFASALAIVAVACSIGLMARYREAYGTNFTNSGASGASRLRVAALSIGAIAALAFSWHVGPIESLTYIDRCSRAILAMSVVASAYAFGLVKLLRLDNEWSKSALLLMPFLVVFAGVLMFSVLMSESGMVDVSIEGTDATSSTMCVGAGMVLSMVTALAAAVLPGKDPFGLSESGRTSYVYVCELLLVLLVIHLRLTVPWLFAGWLQSIWPLLLIALSMAGLVASEVARRLGVRVIAEPLEKTGSLLPMLPLLGHWVMPSQIDYGVSLVSAAIAFGSYAYTKKSMLFWGVCAVAANGALWHTFHNYHLSFSTNPQLWLIPPSLCMLIVVQVLRNRLPRFQVAAARYLATSCIYVSSTAEIFINGISQAPWLPVILAALSVAGMFVGIAIRVRALLWLGMMFLGVALFSIVWHAAVDLQQTWIWYVSGIVLGLMMLVLFGLFEKRREDLKGLIHTLQKWDD